MLQLTPSADFYQSVCVEFHLSKLWSVIPQLSQNRPRFRCFSSFLKNFSNMHRQSKLACLVIFFSRHQSATLDIYKTNSSQPKDKSRNLATLKKDLFATVVNEKLKIVHSSLETLISDVARFLGPSLKLSNHNC